MDLQTDYNPVVLKFELLCQGLRIPPETRAALGQNLKEDFAIGAVGKHAFDIILDIGKIYVGLPIGEAVMEHLLEGTPFALEFLDGRYYVTRKPAYLDSNGKWVCTDEEVTGRPIMPVTLFPRPEYYALKTSSGLPMRNIMPMVSDFAGGTINPYCDFWGHYDARLHGHNCRYCGIGLNIKAGRDLPRKSPGDFVETLAEARKYKYFRHGPVFAGGAHPAPDRGHLEHAEYLRALKEAFPDNWLRLTIAPPEEERYVDALFAGGADLVGYNYEVYDPGLFAQYCPGKVAEIEKGVPGHRHYDRMLSHIVERYGPNRAHANLIVGLEPLESTVRGIEHLASMGVIPTLFVFVPLKGTPLARRTTPSPADLVFLYQQLQEIVENRYHLDTGCGGCHRMMVNTKAYDGLDQRMPDITTADLARAGLPAGALRQPMAAR